MSRVTFPEIGSGISFRSIFPDFETFKRKIIIRTSIDEDVMEYSWKILSGRYWDRIFWWTSGGVCESRFSLKISPWINMQQVFKNNNDATSYNEIANSNAVATYEESEELDINNLETDEDLDEKEGNRTIGSKDITKSKSYSINEFINRETRLNDYLERYVDGMFSTQIRRRVYEKNR